MKLPIGLSEEDMNMLDSSAGMPFTPWPSEEQMKQGALVALHASGGVPEDMLSEEERRGLDAGVVRVVNGVEEEEVGEVRREEQVVRPKKEVITSLSLDLYDPDEE